MRTHISLPGFSEISFSRTKFYKNTTKWTASGLASKIIPNDTCCGLSCPDGCTCHQREAHCYQEAKVARE